MLQVLRRARLSQAVASAQRVSLRNSSTSTARAVARAVARAGTKARHARWPRAAPRASAPRPLLRLLPLLLLLLMYLLRRRANAVGSHQITACTGFVSSSNTRHGRPWRVRAVISVSVLACYAFSHSLILYAAGGDCKRSKAAIKEDADALAVLAMKKED